MITKTNQSTLTNTMSRKGKGKENKESKSKKADSGMSYEPGSASGSGSGAGTPAEKGETVSRKDVALALLAADKGRDWAANFKKGEHISWNLAMAYGYRFILNCDPRKDIFFQVVDPNAGQAAEGKSAGGRGRPAKKKRKGAAGKTYTVGTKFVNVKATREPDGFSIDLVWPVSNCNFACLGLGDWKGCPLNKDREFTKADLKQAWKTLLLDAKAFGTEPVDDQGRSLHFMQAVAKDEEVTRMLFELIVTEHNELCKEYDSQGAPVYLRAVHDELIGSKVRDKQMGYDGAVLQFDEFEAEGSITAEQRKTKTEAARKKYFIDEDGNVDEKQVAELVSVYEIVDALLKKCNTKALKVNSAGVEYVEMKAKVLRRTNKKEKATPPDFPHAAIKAVYEGSDGEYTYNHQGWTFLSEWGKSDTPRVLSPEEREASGMREYLRPIDKGAKLGVVYRYTVFTESPQKTIGTRREIVDFVFLRPPNPDEVVQAQSAGGYKPPESVKFEVPGAMPYAQTALSKPVFDFDPEQAKRMSARIYAEFEEAKKKGAKGAGAGAGDDGEGSGAGSETPSSGKGSFSVRTLVWLVFVALTMWVVSRYQAQGSRA